MTDQEGQAQVVLHINMRTVLIYHTLMIRSRPQPREKKSVIRKKIFIIQYVRNVTLFTRVGTYIICTVWFLNFTRVTDPLRDELKTCKLLSHYWQCLYVYNY